MPTLTFFDTSFHVGYTDGIQVETVLGEKQKERDANQPRRLDKSGFQLKVGGQDGHFL